MWDEKETLGSAIKKFMKEHPDYILDILDFDAFAHCFTESFAYTTFSMNNAAIKMDMTVKQYKDENNKLRQENEELKKKLKK